MRGVVLIPLYMLLPPSGAIQAVVGLGVAITYMVFAARRFFSGGYASVAIKTGLDLAKGKYIKKFLQS